MKEEYTYRETTLEDALEYPRKVVSGEIVACQDVIRQCEIFINDIENRQFQEEFEWRFDQDKAKHVLGFIQRLKFVEGSVALQRLYLSDWQAFILINAYGWVNKEDEEIRRYKTIICMIGRGNAKSMLLATWALYELIFAPHGSQIYSIATKRDQAKLVWNMAGQMVKIGGGKLSEMVNQTTAALSFSDKNNKFVPLAKESRSLDGLNARFLICDESAGIRDANLFEVMQSSMIKQKSPQTVHITTGHHNAQNNYFYGELQYGRKVLSGVLEDERIFTLAYALDPEDEWTDSTKWIKANPNMGLSVHLADLQETCDKAQNIASTKAEFITKHANIFINAKDSWLEAEEWRRGVVETLETDYPLYMGLDLAKTNDLTAVSWVWVGDGKFFFDSLAFLPEAAFQNVNKQYRAIYDQAKDDGSLRITEGDVIDYDAIESFIKEMALKYDLRDIAFDPYNSSQLVKNLMNEGFEMTQVGQGMASLSPYVKELEVDIKKGKLLHLGSPFIEWQATNAVLYVDHNDNVKLNKEDRGEKIDGIDALVNAYALASQVENKPKPNPQFFVL
jgi:phage terminase large subunit-like protein